MSLEHIEALMPFVRHCGIVIEAATKDSVVGSMTFREDLCTAGNILHGGVIMTLGDKLGAVVAMHNLPPGAITATIESKTNLDRPLSRGVLRGTATPLHVGKATIVVQTDLRNDEGKRVALVTQTQAVIPSS